MTNCKAEKEGNKNMSKVKDENYIHIPGWAVTRLGLKGNELLVYSIIYGFSQDGETRFTGGLQYLADWTNSTKQSCIKCLKSLVEKGYIIKHEKIVNGVKFCEYQAVKPKSIVVNKVEQGSKQSLMGIKQSLTGGIKQSLPNILDNNILDNNIDSNIGGNNNAPEKKERFKAPSVEEVQEYCTERGNNIDAQHFIDYYSARGWMLGKNHIKDWKACIRTWERNNSFKPQKYNEEQENKYDQNGYESEEEFMKMFYGK